MPAVILADLAKSDRDLYRKLKRKITYKEKEWLTEHPENYSIYKERLKELAAKYEIYSGSFRNSSRIRSLRSDVRKGMPISQ